MQRPVLAASLVVAAVAGLAALAGAPARATYAARTTADEPQYLLSADSLYADGDLDISNQIDGQAYLPYHEIPIDPQTVPLNPQGREVSPHDPLLPLMLALPHGLGGWMGARVVMALMAAGTAALTVRMATVHFQVPPSTAAVVTAAGFVGLPLAGYGSQIYPEMPAALLTLVAVGGVVTQPGGPGPKLIDSRWAALACVVALPWLSVKYVPVAAAVGLALVARSHTDAGKPRPITISAVAAGAGAVYLLAHYRIYGGATAYASGDHFVDSGQFGVVGFDVDLMGRSRRLIGLLVDRNFGLAGWSPVWFAAPLASASALPHRRLRPLAAVFGVGWLNATYVALTMHGWWVPGRQVVVILPLALVLMAVWADRSKARLAAVAIGGVIGGANWIQLAVESSTGRRTLVVDFFETDAPAYRLIRTVLPDGIRADPTDDLVLAGWAVLITAAVLAQRRLVSRSAGAPTL